MVSLVASLVAEAVELAGTGGVAEDLEGTLGLSLKALAACQDLDCFLSSVVTSVAERAGAAGARLWIHDPVRETLRVHTLCRDGHILRVEGSGYPSASRPAAAASVPIWKQLRASGRPAVTSSTSRKPDDNSYSARLGDGAGTVARIPLVLGTQALGSLGVSFPARRALQAKDLARLQTMAQPVTLATRLKQLSDRARDRAVCEERHRLALEIHDGVTQAFTGIALQLDAAQQIARDPSPELRLHLQQAQALAREAIAEARRIVWALKPAVLEHTNLAGGLKLLASRIFAGTPVRARFRCRGRPHSFGLETEIELLRIAQEAMHNVLKHSGATQLHVALNSTVRSLEIRIRDNGHGFSPEAAGGRRAFGLKAMQDRASRAGARMQIQSLRGKGTQVVITRPAGLPVYEEVETSAHFAGR